MARPERHDAEPGLARARPAADGRWLDGEVGRLRAEFARRLASEAAWTPVVLPGDGRAERTVRFASVAGGYLALGAAYAGMILLILR